MLNRDFPDAENPQNAGNSSRNGLPVSPFDTASVSDDARGLQGQEDCDFFTAQLSAYMDGELDPKMLPVLSDHLDNCPGCAAVLGTMQQNDQQIEREWRESAPLPSSFQFRSSVDAIMDALPPVPAKQTLFARKRVHSKTRWMRVTTGLAGIITLLSLLWASYCYGYAQGKRSYRNSSLNANLFRSMPDLRLASKISLLERSRESTASKLTSAFMLPQRVPTW